jgi:hypothetical protein
VSNIFIGELEEEHSSGISDALLRVNTTNESVFNINDGIIREDSL